MSCVRPHSTAEPALHAAGVAARASAIAETSALELTLRALRPILTRSDVTEVCINRPGEAFIETRSGWQREPLPFADVDWCRRLAKLVANSTAQRIDEESPLLSASLPTGERIQIVLPPATTLGTVAITIRRPSDGVWSVHELAQSGLFKRCVPASSELDETEQTLLKLHHAREFEEFLSIAVRARKNIIVSGATGSGKTTFTKGLILEIPPDERLVTIEDAKELVLDRHPNSVRLYYSKDGQGQARVSPKQLLESCLRMRPDRILLAELRSDEAYYYLRNVNSGHPGSITSVHASSAQLAFEQLMLLVKESPGGRDLAREDIKSLLYMLVDVVVQFGVERHERYVREIWYDPARKRSHLAAAH
jgi:type IV secretion system protein VirB11